MPDRIVPIADDEYGNVVCISVDGPDRGVVYYWDHDHEADAAPDDAGDEPTDANLHKLGEDFDHFLSRLRVPEGKPKQEPELVVDAGDLERLRSMLDAGLPVNWANADGIPLIGLAAARDDVAMVRLLLDRGGDRQWAWNLSCGFGCNEVLKLLVPMGFDWPHLAFLLTVPQTWEDLELVRLVFERGGGDVDGVVDSMGKRPLHYATNDPAAVRLLLALGARPNMSDKWGFMPLHGAAAVGDRVVMQLLIDAGENPYTASSTDGKTPIKWIKDKALRQEIADYAAARGFHPPVKQKASTPKQKRPPE